MMLGLDELCPEERSGLADGVSAKAAPANGVPTIAVATIPVVCARKSRRLKPRFFVFELFSICLPITCMHAEW